MKNALMVFGGTLTAATLAHVLFGGDMAMAANGALSFFVWRILEDKNEQN